MTEYTARQRRQITRHALHRLAMASEDEASEETRDIATAELQRLYRQDDKPDLREPYVARFHVQPGLWLTVDASHNIMLEVRTPDESELLAAYALSSTRDMAHQLELCRIARDAAEQDAGQARLGAVARTQAAIRWSAPREGEDAASRAAAAAELAAAGLGEHALQLVLRRAYGHMGATFNVPGASDLGTVSYDRRAGTYAVRLPEVPAEDAEDARAAARARASIAAGEPVASWEDVKDQAGLRDRG